jgi:hypothetical protein
MSKGIPLPSEPTQPTKVNLQTLLAHSNAHGPVLTSMEFFSGGD